MEYSSEQGYVPVFHLIVTARAYEQAGRRTYKDILRSRGDIFGPTFGHYGELTYNIETMPRDQPADSLSVRRKHAAVYSVTLRLKESRKSLAAALLAFADRPTVTRKGDIMAAIEDVRSDIAEAGTIGIVPRTVKPFGDDDITADEFTACIPGAMRAAMKAMKDCYADKAAVLMSLVNDARQTLADALAAARPRRKDVTAVGIAMSVLAKESDQRMTL